jgi:hypothetical protein
VPGLFFVRRNTVSAEQQELGKQWVLQTFSKEAAERGLQFDGVIWVTTIDDFTHDFASFVIETADQQFVERFKLADLEKTFQATQA